MKETEGVLKDLMEEIHQKNLRYARALEAGEPEVGIFWVVNGKPIIFGKVLSESKQLGDIKGSSDTHLRIWKAYQRNRCVPTDIKYDEPPRGRVEYNVKTRQFHIIADLCIIKSSTVLNKILKELRIPISQYRTGLDEAYRCVRCERR
jgi:hypothetical protein